jgi:hypothetical protein
MSGLPTGTTGHAKSAKKHVTHVDRKKGIALGTQMAQKGHSAVWRFSILNKAVSKKSS